MCVVSSWSFLFYSSSQGFREWEKKNADVLCVLIIQIKLKPRWEQYSIKWFVNYRHSHLSRKYSCRHPHTQTNSYHTCTRIHVLTHTNTSSWFDTNMHNERNPFYFSSLAPPRRTIHINREPGDKEKTWPVKAFMAFPTIAQDYSGIFMMLQYSPQFS